jgi:uncharacterized repeat protein (TIGR01451 family)
MRFKGVLTPASAVLSMVVAAPVLAGVNTWDAIGPAGGNVNKIAFSSTANTVFLIASGGFYRSQDGGLTWQLISSNFFNAPTDLRLDPSDPTRIYVVAPNAPLLYVSTDGGNTLAPLTTLPTNVTSAWQLAVSQNGSTLYLTGGAQVFCSTDRGQTWQLRTAVGSDPNARVLKLIIDPTDSNTLYASVITSATGAAILATHDGAMTWQTLESGSQSTNYAWDLAINPVNPTQLWAAYGNGVWLSPDRGVTWNSVWSSASTTAIALAMDPAAPTVVYAATDRGQVLRTADAGVGWADVTGNMGAGQVLSMAVNPTQDAQVMVGGLAGLSVSATSGNTWAMQQSGINSTTVSGLSADPTIDRIYIEAPTSGAFYEAAGSGTTQAVNNAALLALTGLPSFNITAQLATTGHLYVSLVTGVADSADGGATWSLEPIFPGSYGNQLFTMASPAGASQTVVGASSTALYRTTDAGALWTAVSSGLPTGAVINRLFTAPTNPLVAYASVYGVNASGAGVNLGVYVSGDGGVTWSAAGAAVAAGPAVLLAVDPIAAGTLYGATDSALLKSTDGGGTWTTLAWDPSNAAGFPTALAVDPVHPQILFASRAGIMRSVDAGATWETLRAVNELPFWTPLLLADPRRPENLLAATGNSGVQQLTVAPDLALSVSAPANPVGVGVAFTYAYTVENLGPFAATDVQVTLQLPTTAQNVSATLAGGTCSVASGTANCVLPVMISGASAILTLAATAPAAGPFAVTGAVSGDQPDSNPQNNTAAATSTVAVLADLAVTAGSATQGPPVGAAVSFTLSVNNAGPDPAPTTLLTVQLPAGLSSGTATPSAGTCSTNASGLISCSLDTLAVANPVTVTVNATAAAAGNQVSTATVSSAAMDLVNANNSANITIAVNTPPPPAPPPTPAPAASSSSGGGAVSIGELLALAGLLLWRRSRRMVS